MTHSNSLTQTGFEDCTIAGAVVRVHFGVRRSHNLAVDFVYMLRPYTYELNNIGDANWQQFQGLFAMRYPAMGETIVVEGGESFVIVPVKNHETMMRQVVRDLIAAIDNIFTIHTTSIMDYANYYILKGNALAFQNTRSVHTYAQVITLHACMLIRSLCFQRPETNWSYAGLHEPAVHAEAQEDVSTPFGA